MDKPISWYSIGTVKTKDLDFYYKSKAMIQLTPHTMESVFRRGFDIICRENEIKASSEEHID